MDRGAWQATVPGVAKSRTQLSDQAPTQHSSEKCCKVLVSSNGGVTSIRQALPQITTKNSGKKIFFKLPEDTRKQSKAGRNWSTAYIWKKGLALGKFPLLVFC